MTAGRDDGAHPNRQVSRDRWTNMAPSTGGIIGGVLAGPGGQALGTAVGRAMKTVVKNTSARDFWPGGNRKFAPPKAEDRVG